MEEAKQDLEAKTGEAHHYRTAFLLR